MTAETRGEKKPRKTTATAPHVNGNDGKIRGGGKRLLRSYINCIRISAFDTLARAPRRYTFYNIKKSSR